MSNSVNIEYLGYAGVSKVCLDALVRLIHGRAFKRVRLLTVGPHPHCRHAFLFDNASGFAFIKSGFTSGYPGEGPKTFSIALSFLEAHGFDDMDRPETYLDEFIIDDRMMDRINTCTIRERDLRSINVLPRVSPPRWYQCILRQHRSAYSIEDYKRNPARYTQNLKASADLWAKYTPFVIPFAIISPAMMDLAINFWSDPDARLLDGYRRLEDAVRLMIGSSDHGASLFQKAFLGTPPILKWDVPDGGEQKGRGQLFVGTYMAYRNPRAHRDVGRSDGEVLDELLALNHLFRLLADAKNAELEQ